VLGLVAGNAAQVLVLEGTGNEKVVCCLVACGAILRRSLVAVSHCLRHVSLVTLLAVALGHLFGVRLVAENAFRDLAVSIVAEGTGKGGMLALVVPELYDLLGVAGKARIGDVTTHFDVKR
jgi:hypothetical protein